ncbi:MAG: putative porin [Planctomycetota bacterium]|jgi:type II secretory pathway pseudopilin PulG
MKEGHMNVLGKLLLFAMVLGLLTPSIVQAQQDDDARIERLEAAVRALQAELEALKAERARPARKAPPAVDQKQLEQLVSKTFEEKKDELGAVPDWVQNVKISGDFRYRHEHLDTENASTGRWNNGQDRHRMRARLMVEAMVNDDWDLAFRIASGSDRSPISTNQDLEDSFSKKYVWLDLAYFTWHPASKEGLNVFGGKMKNAFYMAGKNQLIWDTDLNPEGIAAQYVMPLSDIDQLHLNGGGFWVDESTTGVDTSLWGGQAYWKHTIGNPDYILAGLGYYDYGNLKGRGNLPATWGSTAGFTGNTNTGVTYVSDYDIFEAFAEYGFEHAGLPLAVFGSWVQNMVAATDADTGWLIGGKLNKAKEPGSWELGYDYRVLEADAVVGAMSESDWLGGGTDGRGHKFGLKYQIAKNLQAALTYYHLENERNSTRDADYRRLQADLIFKF